MDVVSDDINAYIKEVTEDDFSAKDFRTWNATVLAALALAVSGAAHAQDRPDARDLEGGAGGCALSREHARRLPCLYIDPRVFDRFRDGFAIGGVLDELGEVAYGEPGDPGPHRGGCARPARARPDSPALERVA